MGYRMYVRTKSIISYSNISYFNQCSEGIGNFLQKHCESFYTNDEGSAWEINRQDLQELVTKMKEWIKTNPNDICVCNNNQEYTNTEVLSILLDILKATENKENFDYPDIIFLDWF